MSQVSDTVNYFRTVKKCNFFVFFSSWLRKEKIKEGEGEEIKGKKWG